MGYKLIALDVDGTIRSVGSPIAERTRKAVDAARDAGAIVTLATGRAFRSAITNCAVLGIEAPISTSQGAYIAHPVSEEVLRHCPLTADAALAALDAVETHADYDAVQVVAYYPGRLYVDDMTEWAAGYGERTDIAVELVADLREIADIGITRIVAVGIEDYDAVARVERSVKAELATQALVMRSLPYFCEILHPNGGKEDALAWMCDYFGIEHSETIAFGNGYNDIQMLEWVRLGIAVGDAVPEALAVADMIAPPFEEHGVAQMLEELLDKGLIG